MRFYRILFLILIFPAVAVAQLANDRFYTIDNLFSQQLIKAVARDNEGYLWVATDDGVLRYDGIETKYYKELSGRYTKAFLKSKNDKFYVLHDSGINEISKERDSVYFKPLSLGKNTYDAPLNYPKSIYEDIDGNIWVGEMNAVVRFNAQGMKRFELGEPFRSINYHRTFSFTEDAFGNLWIAPFKGPLLYYNKERGELKEANTKYPLTDVCGIATLKGDYLLLGGKQGVLKLKVDSDKNILATEFITGADNISVVASAGKNAAYVGTWTNGLYYFDLEEKRNFLRKLPGVPVNDVLAIYPDDFSNEVWVAGSENIGLFKSAPVAELAQVGQNRIESMTIDEENGIYYSIGGQVFYVNNVDGGISKEILSANETYFARIQIEESKLWIGDAFGRILCYDIKSRSTKTILGETSASIQYLYKDRTGNKWFTGHPRGLIKIDASGVLKFYESMTSSVVTRESSRGKLFCGRNGKNTLLSLYNESSDEFVPLALEFGFACSPSIILHDFQFDSLDNLWLATDEGLLKIKNENGNYQSIERITISGFPETEQYKSIAISDSLLYLSNSFGLVVCKNEECISFSQDSGLPSKLLKERGLVFDKDENLFVATAKGIAFFRKELLEFRPTIAPVFKRILINGSPMSLENDHAYTFPFKTRIEVEFIALSYPAATISYQTKISGVDRDWSTPSTGRNISILGFSEGTYTVQVRAREDGKLWSKSLSFQFVISKPWYRTWWAIVAVGLITVIAVVTYVKIHNNNLIRQKKNLQKIVDERTEQVDRQKNELIEQQKKIIQQKQEIIEKNEAVYKSQQALTEADMNYLQLKEKQLQEQIDYKNKQVTTHALNIIQKNETLQGLRNKLEEIVKKPERITVVELRRTLRIIDESFKLDKDWDDFKLYFEQVHTGFYAKLKTSYPDLTTQELRHCSLIRLNLTISECASILGISHDSTKVSRTRLRKKLHLDPSQSMTDFILGL